jgi:hypothetical protein
VDAIAVCGCWPDKSHPLQPAPEDVLVPFGKYKGQTVKKLAADQVVLHHWESTESDVVRAYPQVCCLCVDQHSHACCAGC